MKIAVAMENGQIMQQLGKCKSFLIVTAENGKETGRETVSCAGDGHIGMLDLMAKQQAETLICGDLGLGTRNALQMLGLELVPGCTGDADTAIAKYLAGEAQGDPAVLRSRADEAEDDPLECLHDCGKCGGCGAPKI